MKQQRSPVREFVLPVGVAALATLPAMYLRFSGGSAGPVGNSLLFGVAILAAGFLLSWGAEAAERYVATGLVLALVALITVLPEYAVDFSYAYRAGADPASGYAAYAAANMTGANRLLIGLAWPLMVLLHWWRSKQRGIALQSQNRVETGFLALASLYAFVIVVKNSISLLDFAILAAIFGAYLFRTAKMPEADGEEEAEEPGPAAIIALLSPAWRWTVMGALTVIAAAVILLAAEPFAESLVQAGTRLGIDEFLLIQWLAPLASEAPAITIAILFVFDDRARAALTTMVSDKINQWTLLVGMLPVAMSIGAGSLTALPLDARQHEEFFLTATQSLFGLALLMQLRLSVASAVSLSGLFVVQVAAAFYFQDDAETQIAVLTGIGWMYLALAVLLIARNYREVPAIVRATFGLKPPAGQA